MWVSPHTAQAFLDARVIGRGATTELVGLWTCMWQLGCRRRRFSVPSVPPLDLQITWWLCHPVIVVIGSLQFGQRPFCWFQRNSNVRYPLRLASTFTARRCAK